MSGATLDRSDIEHEKCRRSMLAKTLGRAEKERKINTRTVFLRRKKKKGRNENRSSA